MSTHTRITAGSGDNGPALAAQHVVAEARQLLNRIEFDAACGATLQGDLAFVSVMPTSDEQKAGCFGIIVVCRPRSRQPVDWSTLRVYISPKAGKGLGSLGPSLDRFGQTRINNLTQGDYALRAYHSPGEDALRVLEKLFAGAATKVRVAVDTARRWIDQLITSAEFIVASPMPSMRSLDRNSAGSKDPTAAAGWILQRIDSEEGSNRVMLVATTSEQPDEHEPVQVRVLAWPHEVIERVRHASGEMEFKTGDVYRLFDEWVEHSGELLIEVDVPAGFKSKPISGAARIPVDENGVVQIVLELVPDA